MSFEESNCCPEELQSISPNQSISLFPLRQVMSTLGTSPCENTPMNDVGRIKGEFQGPLHQAPIQQFTFSDHWIVFEQLMDDERKRGVSTWGMFGLGFAWSGYTWLGYGYARARHRCHTNS